MGKNYVLHSTPESREQHTTSLLAIFETLFFVLLTWGVAYYYDTYTHIYVAIAIAPFLLLKTPRSTKKAIEVFLYKSKTNGKVYHKILSSLIITIISSILLFISIYFFSIKTLTHYDGWELFLLSILLGILLSAIIIIAMISILALTLTVKGIIGRSTILAKVLAITITVAVAVAGITGIEAPIATIGISIGMAIALLGTMGLESKYKFIQIITLPFNIIFSLSMGLGFFLRSIIIKFSITLFYTLFYPKEAFYNIFKNWNEQIIVNDIFYTPELLPEIHKVDSSFQLSSFYNKRENLFETIILVPIALIWSLGYLYRFSIKSTAWFFFPLAYLANLNALQDEDKKLKAMKTQTWKKLFWFNMIVSAVLLLYFNYTGQYIELLGLSEAKLAFLTKITALLRQYIIKDAMWLLVVAVTLYFIMNTFISRKEHLDDSNYHIFGYWIIKLIFVLWMVFLGWHLVVLTNHFVLPELTKLL